MSRLLKIIFVIAFVVLLSSCRITVKVQEGSKTIEDSKGQLVELGVEV